MNLLLMCKAGRGWGFLLDDELETVNGTTGLVDVFSEHLEGVEQAFERFGGIALCICGNAFQEKGGRRPIVYSGAFMGGVFCLMGLFGCRLHMILIDLELPNELPEVVGGTA